MMDLTTRRDRALLRFLLFCALAYWVWCLSLEVTALRVAVQRSSNQTVEVHTPVEVLREWLREQVWLQP
ncbi:MAG: hypothetical protein ACOYKZ_03870 [Chlamydiia bacterium]